jgi:hypothetical protein
MGLRARSTLLLLLGAACHSAPSQPVPVAGESGDVLALAGEWDGTYEADDRARSGTIDFHLRAGSDTAFGDVIMVPMGWNQPITPEDRPGAQVREPLPQRLLQIRFVRVSGGEVSGELERYRDPECGCLLRTVFRGRLHADTLSGGYLSYHQDGEPPTSGRWRAQRKSTAP